MAGRIPQQFIQDLLSRVDIVDVISERIQLKKTGQNYAACCPFHNEKTPSFTVSPDKQFYHCFGCGAHGSAIGFLMEYERLEFPDAVRQLAARVGLEIPQGTGNGKAAEDHRPVYEVLDAAAKYFATQLRGPVAATAVEYLKGRGLSGAIAKEYGIGFAPPGWDNLLSHLGRDDGSRKLLARAGLVIEKDGGGYYDRFRNRVVFPIRDARGRVIGFGGRVLDDDTPKYLNSPETPVFHKGRELYGLYEARRHSRDLAQLIVVEGYMDVVGLAQFGVRHAVATLGTATTPDHIDRLFRLTGDVIFCFDGDNAGRKAAWRALEAALPRMTGHHQVRFMFLPEGDDPDSLVRKEGQEKFLARTVTAIPLSAFLFEHLAAQADLSSIDGRARLVELARPHLSKVPSGVFQQMLLGRLAEMVEIDPVQLSRAYGGERVAAAKSAAQAVRYRTEHVPPSAARIAVKLLLTEPALAQHVADASRISGKDPRAKLVLKMIELLRERPNMTQAMMVEFFRGTPEGAYLDKVARWNWTAPVDGLGAEFDGAIERLAAQNIDARTQELLEKARIAGLTPEEKHELKQLVAVKLPAAKAERNGTYGSH